MLRIFTIIFNLTLFLSLLFPFNVHGQNPSDCVPDYEHPEIKHPDDYQNKVYIDPTYTGTEDGSIQHPFNSWKDITITENTAYLIKSGTSIETGIKIEAKNNYLGKYGKGDRPILYEYLFITGSDLVVDSLNIISYGNTQYQKVLDIGYADYITIANSYVTGLPGSYSYPYYLCRGTGEHVTFYNNIMSGAQEDGLYIGSSPYFTFVRNWVYDTNMGGVDVAYGGDGIQLEYDNYIHAYFAGNLIDRHNTMSKFCLILNAENLTHDVVCEWNTFIGPKNGNGGAAIRWWGGKDNKFNKNLIITYLEEDNKDHQISGIATHDGAANQDPPYGIRDNHFYGLGKMFFGVSSYDPSNVGFSSEEEYDTWLTNNNKCRYGSDINTSDFWNINPGLVLNASNEVQNTQLTGLFIYPNPAQTRISFKDNSGKPEAYNVRLFNLSGETVFRDNLLISSKEEAILNLPDLKSGLYMLHILNTNTGESKSRKLVIE